MEEEKLQGSFEMPFDVDNLLNIKVTYDFDVLKLSLKYIIDQLRNVKQKMASLDKQVNNIKIPEPVVVGPATTAQSTIEIPPPEVTLVMHKEL